MQNKDKSKIFPLNKHFCHCETKRSIPYKTLEYLSFRVRKFKKIPKRTRLTRKWIIFHITSIDLITSGIFSCLLQFSRMSIIPLSHQHISFRKLACMRKVRFCHENVDLCRDPCLTWLTQRISSHRGYARRVIFGCQGLLYEGIFRWIRLNIMLLYKHVLFRSLSPSVLTIANSCEWCHLIMLFVPLLSSYL